MSEDLQLNDLLLAIAARQQPIFLALSGGMDSVFLFHRLCDLQIEFTAIHINHQLQADSPRWQQFCQQLAAKYGVPILVKQVQVDREVASIEQAARQARLSAFTQLLSEPSIIMTAHHLDDQVETFFLRLMRGATLNGLQAMRPERSLHQHCMLKPLLAVSRQYILSQMQSYQWVEDPSNDSDAFDRNYLRNQVLPLLAERWPSYRQSINRSIEAITQAYQREKQHYQDFLQQHANQQQLSIAQAQAFELAQLIYYWSLLTLNIVLSRNIISAIAQLPVAKNSQTAQVQSVYGRFYYTKHRLIFEAKSEQKQTTVAPVTFRRRDNMPCVGLRADLDIEGLTVGSRPVNQKLKVVGRHRRRDLKRLLQELPLTSECKQALPYIFYRQQLIAIGRYYIVEEFACLQNDAGIEIICLNQD